MKTIERVQAKIASAASSSGIKSTLVKRTIAAANAKLAAGMDIFFARKNQWKGGGTIYSAL